MFEPDVITFSRTCHKIVKDISCRLLYVDQEMLNIQEHLIGPLDRHVLYFGDFVIFFQNKFHHNADSTQQLTIWTVHGQ